MSLYILLHPLTFSVVLSDPEQTIPTEDSEIVNIIDKGKGKEIERGRTLKRSPRIANPLATAESRLRVSDVAIELDGRPIQKRAGRSNTFHEDPPDLCAILDDNVLEPCPHTSIYSTVSEVLNSSPADALQANSINPINTKFVFQRKMPPMVCQFPPLLLCSANVNGSAQYPAFLRSSHLMHCQTSAISNTWLLNRLLRSGQLVKHQLTAH
jgi:hypothetical protein